MPRANQSYERACKWAAMVEQGITLREIAEQEGISHQRVHQILTHHGFDTSRVYKYDNLDVASIYDRYVKGARLDDLAIEFGVSGKEYLTQLLNKHGYKLRKSGSRTSTWTPERIMELYIDYQSGMSQPDIAAKHGCRQSYISAVMRRYGIEARDSSTSVTIAKQKRKRGT